MGETLKTPFLPLPPDEERTSIKFQTKRKTAREVSAVVAGFAILGWLCFLTIKLGVIMGEKESMLGDATEENKEDVAEIIINEHGFQYRQTVSYNPVSQITTIYVPQHPGIDSSTTMYHQTASMQVILNHDKLFCELSSLPKTYESRSIVEGAKTAQNEHISISSENSAFLGLEIQIDHLLTQDETNHLAPEIQGLCSGMQIYKVSYVPTDMTREDFSRLPPDDDTLNSTSIVTIHRNNGSGRVKRHTVFSSCPMEQSIEKCTMSQTWGKTCKWLICRSVEDPSSFTQCARVISESTRNIPSTFPGGQSTALHIAHSYRRCTHCCAATAQPDSCKCTQVVDKNSFEQCQLKNDCAAHITTSRSCNHLWPQNFARSEYTGSLHSHRSG